jgi:hypothetical protein
MLYWIIQITIISFVLIFLVHHLINFFKSTLTVPKIKDLVNSPTQKYENMYNIINSRTNRNNISNNGSNNCNSNINDSVNNYEINNEYTLIDLLPKKDENNMKSELKNFLKTQLNELNTNVSQFTSDKLFYSNY